MQLILATALFLATLAQHYGYYLLPGVEARAFYALSGLQELIVAIVIAHLVFRRWTDWRATVVLMLALLVSVVENLMVFVCGSWYAFVYTGPIIRGDRCEVMSGMQISKPMAYTLGTLTLIIVPRVWSKTWGTLR